MSFCRIASCSLNQWALDFDGNEARVMMSITESHSKGATLRVGPELEICGYGCEDEFKSSDLYEHCWESLSNIASRTSYMDILLDIGMPCLYKSVAYNCRILLYRGRILLIRPKTILANDGNYRESRWFCSHPPENPIEEYILPECFLLQRKAPFGVGILRLGDCVIAVEICEELWVPDSPNIMYGYEGVDIICNGSASHYEEGILAKRTRLIQSAGYSSGGVYVYSNCNGCDGGRLCFDGAQMIAVNGEIVSRGPSFYYGDQYTIVCDVDISTVRQYRLSNRSRCVRASEISKNSYSPNILHYPDILICRDRYKLNKIVYHEIHPILPLEEELVRGAGLWLWDQLRRGSATGFFIPLSGGVDSASVLLIVGYMCAQLHNCIQSDVAQIEVDVLGVLNRSSPRNAMQMSQYRFRYREDLVHALVKTAYLRSGNSSANSCSLARHLSADVGSDHYVMDIDGMCNSFISSFMKNIHHGVVSNTPRFVCHGGTITEDLALQNIQARCRMVSSYMCAQLLREAKGSMGFLLVLGTGNLDEAVRGYLTKYDCSSGDLSPIGGMSKNNLLRMLKWAVNSEWNYGTLLEISLATPSAELRPSMQSISGINNVESLACTTTDVLLIPNCGTNNIGDIDNFITAPFRGKEPDSNQIIPHVQSDEEEMGITYEELSLFGKLRVAECCGPVSMFRKLVHRRDLFTGPSFLATKIESFYLHYTKNRHKTTVLPPSFHSQAHSVDDNRYDLRQFLYPPLKRQFAKMRKEALEEEEESTFVTREKC